MVFPPEFELRLGFDQIRARIINYCNGPLGVENVDQISFQTDPTFIRTLLKQTLELKLIIESGKEFPSTTHINPLEYFGTAAIEGTYLEEEAFQEIIRSISLIISIKDFINSNHEVYPDLNRLANEVTDLKGFYKSIEIKFNDLGFIKDTATPELAKVRKRIREEENKARRLLDHIFRNAVEQGWVPIGISPTIRDGRLVVPVTSEHKRKIRGFIMDESSTGQTIYIEPAEVLEANNEIRDLLHEERREVIKILKELTTILRNHLHLLNPAFHFIGWIDFTKAKARFAIDIGADMPNVVDNPDLNWLYARHPLLLLSLKGKRDVVPLTIDLTSEESFLLISGPNAGGKSVCLKTVGLLQYMVQCGILPSMHDRSTVGIFDKIFLDIGDQQSIENDLSTYSSHLNNMNFFIRNADENSLILLDELGSGTDPNFGGGISEAILSNLISKKGWGVATTHYYNLKLFASNHEGIRNGAMLFDVDKLEPLFKLEIGKPGSSFALEIAKKTGLPEAIIANAEKIIGTELTGLEQLMKTLAEEKKSVEDKLMSIAKKDKEISQVKSRYETLLSELETKKKEIINKAKDEAYSLLRETNKEIEKTIRHIRENKAEKKETKKVRQGLKDLTSKVKLPVKEVEKRNEKIVVDDKVRMIGQLVTGTVLSIKDDTAIVQFGDLRSNIKLKQLIRSDLVESTLSTSSRKSHGLDVMQKKSSFDPTLDIRGKRAEEVLPILERFIDDAILLGQSQLKIIHGKGEGVLRNVVRDYLKKVQEIESITDDHADRGGAGITLIVLK
jgi:DNA mismatch repair protein MutS2